MQEDADNSVEMKQMTQISAIVWLHLPKLARSDAFRDPFGRLRHPGQSSRSHKPQPADPNGFKGHDARQLNSLLRLLPRLSEVMNLPVVG